MAKEIKCNVKVQALIDNEWVDQEVETIEDLENAQNLIKENKARFKFSK